MERKVAALATRPLRISTNGLVATMIYAFNLPAGLWTAGQRSEIAHKLQQNVSADMGSNAKAQR
jgi:hypothetical protein